MGLLHCPRSSSKGGLCQIFPRGFVEKIKKRPKVRFPDFQPKKADASLCFKRFFFAVCDFPFFGFRKCDYFSGTHFLNDIIGQQIQTTYKIDNNPRLRYTPESRINANTGEIFGDDDVVADYQIAASRLKEMEDSNRSQSVKRAEIGLGPAS